MTASLIDGKKIADQILEELKPKIQRLVQSKGFAPGLAVVLVGENPSSKVYVSMKEKACQKMGLHSEKYHLASTITQQELLSHLDKLNANPKIHGILVQMPLPAQLDTQEILRHVHPQKDVDGFHPENVGRMLIGDPLFLPCTPAGIVQLLVRHGIAVEGRHVVIVGRSNIVGKPLAAILMQKSPDANATVTVCHSQSKNLREICLSADILVAAVGKPKMITADMVRNGAVVIDVGVNQVPDATNPKGYKLVGDVDFDPVCAKASAITPVPGGVGPMTIAMLMHNTVKAALLTGDIKNQ